MFCNLAEMCRGDRGESKRERGQRIEKLDRKRGNVMKIRRGEGRQKEDEGGGADEYMG